ncbi:MAG: hypothetical protein JWL81_805 [Verrucomicrobiales bacterium]|nr:hypothetical protein [Verrucomicrobiales bacterium]
MWEGTAEPQFEQEFSLGACQRWEAARIFCLLREDLRFGTAMGWGRGVEDLSEETRNL